MERPWGGCEVLTLRNKQTRQRSVALFITRHMISYSRYRRHESNTDRFNRTRDIKMTLRVRRTVSVPAYPHRCRLSVSRGRVAGYPRGVFSAFVPAQVSPAWLLDSVSHYTRLPLDEYADAARLASQEI